MIVSLFYLHQVNEHNVMMILTAYASK